LTSCHGQPVRAPSLASAERSWRCWERAVGANAIGTDCFVTVITHPLLPASGQLLRTKSINEINIRQCSVLQPPPPAGKARALCGCDMVGGAPLPRYANMLGVKDRPRKSRSCTADAGTPLKLRL